VIDELAELQDLDGAVQELEDQGREVTVEDLRRLAARRAKRQRAAAKRREAARARRLVLRGVCAGVHPTRPWWKWVAEQNRWKRTDGQNWPARPADVLDLELARFDQTIPRREGYPERWEGGSVLSPGRWRVALRAAALAPLEAVRALWQLERRIATLERDARVRPSAGQALAWCTAKLEAHRDRVRALRVRVPWKTAVYGQGALP
jgi:hypothetical protein